MLCKLGNYTVAACKKQHYEKIEINESANVDCPLLKIKNLKMDQSDVSYNRCTHPTSCTLPGLCWLGRKPGS